MEQEEARKWAEENFAGAEMSDVRRLERVIGIAEAMALTPGKSIPKLFAHSYDVKASYNFFQHREATPDNIQAGHREIVLAALEKPGRYLLIEDTSELSWSGKQTIDGLGPIGNGSEGMQGFHLHSVLAARWIKPVGSEPEPVAVIGFADQQYYVRQPRPESEGSNNSQRRKYRERESQLWSHSTQRIGVASNNSEIEWIRVCDRAADIYEFLESCQQANHRFVIRANQDRALVSNDEQSPQHLFSKVREQTALGEFELYLRARKQQPARNVKLSVSAVKVSLRSPWRPGKALGESAINCTAIRVWEAEPVDGIEPLEWILLSDLEVMNFEQALECALIYSTRWLIEEFHKALKTGLGAEKLQLGTAEQLFAAIAIMSIVALRLIDLRERVRLYADAPAQAAGLDELELEILSVKLARNITTVKDVALAIGRLGGHMNRKADGMPGWQSLWHGMMQLSALAEGARLARKLTKFG
jgi:hypothetical protein